MYSANSTILFLNKIKKDIYGDVLFILMENIELTEWLKIQSYSNSELLIMGSSTHKSVSGKRKEALHLLYASKKQYDQILLVDTFEHFREYTAALQLLYKRLNKNGKLIVISSASIRKTNKKNEQTLNYLELVKKSRIENYTVQVILLDDSEYNGEIKKYAFILKKPFLPQNKALKLYFRIINEQLKSHV